MAININANMSLGAAEYLDARQSVATLDDLLNLNTNIIPNGFEVYVNDLDCKYKYHEDYNEDSTGNWKLIGEVGAVKNYLRLKGTVGYEPQMVEITPSLVQRVLTNATSETIEGRWILEEAETNTEIFDTDGNFSLPALEKVTFTKLDDYKVLGITDITSTAISCRAITDIDVPFEFILEWKEENGAGHIELTQAEYDALPEEEKMNGAIYFITDATGGSDDVELIEYAYSIVEPAGSFSIYYSYEDLVTKIGSYVPVTTYNRKYGEWVVNIYVVRQNDEGNIEIINESGYETIIAPIGTGTVATLPFIKDTRASSQTTWSSKQIASALLGDDQLNEFSNNSVQNWVLAGKFKEIEDKLDGESGVTTYSSLEELGLTAPVTVGDIFNAMPDSSMAVIACEDVTEHITDVPMHYGVLTIKKSAVGRFSIDFQNSLASSPCNVKKWIGTLKGDDGTGLYWREVAYKENLSNYKSLSELGLDTTATLKDITRAMAKSSMIAIKVDAMANQSEYNNITQGTVTIYKIEDARIQAIMTEKSTGRTWIGTLGGENTITGWKEIRSDSPFYRIVTQGIAGYFKFKPTSTGIDQPLRISVTDNYGGMINISGATPSGSQYKPFKCIRLSNGTYADYDAIKTTNNKMEKLYYYDGYFYLKVVSYTTCTFVGLIEAPTYVETFDEENAEQIPIRSVFDTPYNNGYADPSTMVIGDADSTDGVIKTLATLGFTSDIMTWDNGEYRVSHVGGLTNLPAEITEEKPGFRLEHHDVKKWGSNHNPHHSTYGCRQSILHYKSGIFVRYQESGASAGVITTDTGWQKVSTNTKELVTNAQNFKLDITKRNASFYGFIKLEYLYGYHLCEVCIGISSAIAYTVTKGKNLIDKITYTVDGANIVFGIDFTSKVYGVQVVEMPSDFGTINSLTAESFTGSTVANQTGLDLELHKQVKVVTSLDKGTWQVGQRIKQKTDFTANTNDVNFEFVAKNESSSSTGKYQKMTIYQLTPIENGTNASTSYSVFEDGKAQVSVWPHTENMPRNDYNIACEGYVNNGGAFNGQAVKSVTIDLSNSALQSTSSGLAAMSLANFISGSANVIKVEGYYIPPTGANTTLKKVIVRADIDNKLGGIIHTNNNWNFVVYGATNGSKGSGYAKIYYVD